MAHFPVGASLQDLRVILIVRRPGMCVLVSKVDPLMEKETREGVIVGHSATELHVTFEKRWNIDNEKWRYGKKPWFRKRTNTANDRLDIGTSDSSYTRMMEALRSLHDCPKTQDAASTIDQEIGLNGTYLRDIILSAFGSFSMEDLLEGNANESMSSPGFFVNNEDIMDWAQRYNRDDPLMKAGDPEISLNKSQIRAIAQMLSERVSLVQGVSIIDFRLFRSTCHIDFSLQEPERRRRSSKRSGYLRSTSKYITLF